MAEQSPTGSTTVSPTESLPRTVRESRFELLRILAMFMIVANHFAYQPLIPFNALRGISDTAFVNIILTQTLTVGGKLGVFLFGAVSGYFLIAKTPRLSSLLRIIALTVFYSAALYLLALSQGRAVINLKELCLNFLPLTFYRYWFITAYALLMLCAPFINLGLNAASRRQHRYLLILFGVLWYVIPTIFIFNPLNVGKFYENEFLTLVYAYSCGAYIKRFVKEERIQTLRLWSVILGCLTCQVLYLIAAQLHGLVTDPSKLIIFWPWITGYSSVFTLLWGLCVFLLFLKLPTFFSPAVNRLAACMLGVYLLHDNTFVKPWLWHEIINPKPHILEDSTPAYLLYAAGSIITLFLVCATLEMIRAKLAAPLSSSFAAALSRCDNWYRELFANAAEANNASGDTAPEERAGKNEMPKAQQGQSSPAEQKAARDENIALKEPGQL